MPRDEGASWATCSAIEYFQRDTGTYQCRSIDAEGFAGYLAKIQR